jgi:transposase
MRGQTTRSKKGRASPRKHDVDPGRSPQHNVEQFEAEVERLRRELNDAKKQIADLERQLALRQHNSTNVVQAAVVRRPRGSPAGAGRRTKSRRKPGGQVGHPGHCRSLVPLARVNHVVEVFPEACRHCLHALPARRRAVTGEPRRHQVTELPPMEALITEYQCPSVVCPACGKTTRAPLPDDVDGQFGPQLTALIAYLTVVCRVPRRLVQALVEGAWHIPISLGGTQAAWGEASDAVDAPCRELEQALKQQPVLNGDETGHRPNAEKRWLWAVVAPTFVVYRIAMTRGAEVLVDLLGDVFAGVLCSDRWRPYHTYHHGALQFCWAHFKRNVLGALDLAKTTEAERFCRDALALHARLFRLWYRFRGDPAAHGGPLTRPQLIEHVLPLQRTFFALGERHLDSRNTDVRNLATALFAHHEKCFVFVHHEGVEPTNNRAERALRCAVQWRKIMFGNRSETGEFAVARLLTVTRTCQMQQLNALAYLTAAIRAHRRHQAVASLLPKRS